MSERTRKAMALDAIEEMVELACASAANGAAESEHFQYDVALDISDAVRQASVIYGIGECDLMPEALAMLRNGLNAALRPIREVRYVKPYETDNVVVGMAAKCYRIGRRTE